MAEKNDTIALQVTSNGMMCVTNDCNPRVLHADHTFDASDSLFCQNMKTALGTDSPPIRSVITSPPYSVNVLIPIIRNALALATHYVIMKLPLNFMIVGPLQEDRRLFWKDHPLHGIMPLSRSVAMRGHRVKVDEAWYIWCLNDAPKPLTPFVFAM